MRSDFQKSFSKSFPQSFSEETKKQIKEEIKKSKKEKKIFYFLIFLSFVFLLTSAGTIFLKNLKLENKLENLNLNIEKLKLNKEKNYEIIHQWETASQGQKALVNFENIEIENKAWLRFFDLLPQSLPKNIYLKNIIFSDNNFKLEGMLLGLINQASLEKWLVNINPMGSSREPLISEIEGESFTVIFHEQEQAKEGDLDLEGT